MYDEIEQVAARARAGLKKEGPRSWNVRELRILGHYGEQMAKGRISLNVAADKSVSDIKGRNTYGVA